jgi:hypothetical protein
MIKDLQMIDRMHQCRLPGYCVKCYLERQNSYTCTVKPHNNQRAIIILTNIN